MKNKIYLAALFLLLGAVTAKAQTNTLASDTTVYVAVEHPAEFPGGTAKLYPAIWKNVRYPADARINNIQGTVVVTFVIEKDGRVSNAKVLRSLSADTDAEALRVINKLPKWKPATQNGQPVRFQYTTEVAFKLAN